MVQPKRTASALDSDAVLGNSQNWKKRKQERAYSARFIQAQSNRSSSSISKVRPVSALSSAGSPQHDTHGVENPAVPTSVEVEAVIASRAFQIQSFLRSIKSAKSATTTRAWQLLPRHARRRAASHNLLRLPSRLRGKALAELKSSTTQARTKSETRRRMPDHGVIRATLRRQKLAHRASHPKRRWLETHLWHAKRFRMTIEKGKGKEKEQGVSHGRWGFVLPETTMMKSHKASWRSALEHSTIHDASYHSVIRVGIVRTQNGGEQDLRSKLMFLLCSGGFGPFDLFTASPHTQLVFDTVLRRTTTSAQPDIKDNLAQFAQVTNAALAPIRVVILPRTHLFSQRDKENIFICQEALIFVHPAGQVYVRRALKETGCILTDEEKNKSLNMQAVSETQSQAYAYQLTSAPDPWIASGGKDCTTPKLEKKHKRQAFTIGSIRQGNEPKSMQNDDEVMPQAVELDDITEARRKQGYNIFEVVGPKAPVLLRSILRLDEKRNTRATRAALQNLLRGFHGTKGTKGTSGHEANMVAMEVHDPRLSFPPRLRPISASAPVSKQRSIQVQTDSRLLSFGASGPNFSKGQIDSRRANGRVPGSRLEPDPRDDVIPVVLIRQTLVGESEMNSFTLIVPRGWGTAFFLSLVATTPSGASSGARVIGQHQLRHQKLELSALASSQHVETLECAGMLSYPFNWPGTLAYAQSDKEAVTARLEVWKKRPKGKRTEFRWPTMSDWKAFVKQNTQLQESHALMSKDRTGAARPFPFGGLGTFDWIADNSKALYGPTNAHSASAEQTWLLASPKLDQEALLSIETSLTASVVASALVPLQLRAIRKGTISSQSSLMLAPTYEDHISWVHHLDSTHHPALIANRANNSKMDKKHLKALVERRLEIMQLGTSAPRNANGGLDTQLASRKKGVNNDVWSQYLRTAPDPELLHNSSADWNHCIGLILDGAYSLGNGQGFGIGTVTMRAWRELLERQVRLDSMHMHNRAGRTPRNPITTSHLLLMREPGSDVLRAVNASFIPL